MLEEVEDPARRFRRTEHDALVPELGTAVTWEPTFLAGPSRAVWTHIFSVDRRESLLPPASACRR